MRAMIRGMIKTSIGLSPKVFSASTSWLIFIIPIWAVIELPVRPATKIAVIKTPTSRNIEMLTKLMV